MHESTGPVCYRWEEWLELFPDEPIDVDLIDPCSIPPEVLDEQQAWMQSAYRPPAGAQRLVDVA
jgi:hypothetical protein